MFHKEPSPEQVLIRHGRCRRSVLPAAFTVCSWNFQKSKRAGWPDMFTQLAAEADLFLAQEVRLSPRTSRALEQTPYAWTGAVSFFSARGQYPTGVATGCTAAAERADFRIGAREPFLHIPKMALSAVFALETGRRLLTVNVHAINFTGLKPFERHLRQTAQLLRDFDGPVLLGGDFNAWNAPRQRALAAFARAAGLDEVFFTPDERKSCLGRPLDFLFVRGLTPVWAKTVSTRASDHRPLLARFRL